MQASLSVMNVWQSRFNNRGILWSSYRSVWKDRESGLNHYGGPLKLMQACLGTGNVWWSLCWNFRAWNSRPFRDRFSLMLLTSLLPLLWLSTTSDSAQCPPFSVEIIRSAAPGCGSDESSDGSPVANRTRSRVNEAEVIQLSHFQSETAVACNDHACVGSESQSVGLSTVIAWKLLIQPTRLGIWLQDLGLLNKYSVGHVAFLLLLDTRLFFTKRHYALLTATDTAFFKVDLSLSSKFWSW